MGMYAFTDNLHATMCFSFKDSRNCKNILKKELKKRYVAHLVSTGQLDKFNRLEKDPDDDDESVGNEGHHHHHHHNEDEIDHLHPHDPQKCAVCVLPEKNDAICDWLSQIHKFIQQLMDENFRNRRANFENQLLNIKFYRRKMRLQRKARSLSHQLRNQEMALIRPSREERAQIIWQKKQVIDL